MLLQASQCKYLSPCFRLFWNVPKGNWWTVKNVFIFCKGSYCACCSSIILYKVISRGQESGSSTALSMFVTVLDKRCETAFYSVFYFIFQMTSDIKHLFVHLTPIHILWRICVCVCGDICMYMCIREAWYQYGVPFSRPLGLPIWLSKLDRRPPCLPGKHCTEWAIVPAFWRNFRQVLWCFVLLDLQD